MKIIPRLLLLCASVLHSQKPQASDLGLDLALHSTFIKCYVRHWRGSEVSDITGSNNKVRMICDGFWAKFVSASKNPTTADSEISPFELLIPGCAPAGIPFSVWNGYLSDTLAISTANPLRKNK